MTKKRRFIAMGSVIILILIAALALWPTTVPWIIRTKIRVIGPQLVYGPLAYDDDLWETVLKGVRSGDASWIQVATGLRPALDTHPGEEMLGAVSVVIDKNPVQAINILIPTYGAEIVCGADEEGGRIDRNKADQRKQLLAGLTQSDINQQSLNDCRQALTITTKEK